MALSDVASLIALRADAHALLEGVRRELAEAAEAVAACLRDGATVYACGNGGSATQAAHFAGELVGRFKTERRALPAFCLSDNPAIVTAVANDYGYDSVFERQLDGLARRGDCLLALTTSGNSENVVRACAAAQRRGARVVALTGRGGGRTARHADVLVAVDSTETDRIQETHLMIIHLLCEYAEGRAGS